MSFRQQLAWICYCTCEDQVHSMNVSYLLQQSSLCKMAIALHNWKPHRRLSFCCNMLLLNRYKLMMQKDCLNALFALIFVLSRLSYPRVQRDKCHFICSGVSCFSSFQNHPFGFEMQRGSLPPSVCHLKTDFF